MLKKGQAAGYKNPYKNGFLPKIAYHLASNNPEKVSYFFNRQAQVYTLAADFLLESTESQRAIILDKLCPDLEIVDVYEGNHLIFKLK